MLTQKNELWQSIYCQRPHPCGVVLTQKNELWQSRLLIGLQSIAVVLTQKNELWQSIGYWLVVQG